MNKEERYKKILEYISSEEEKNFKKRMEYLEVGENKKAEKYEEKQMMFNRMYNLVKYAIYYLEKSDSNEQRFTAKLLNAVLTGDKFENRDIDNYLYASLTQPPIKILDKRNSNDELDYIVECPNCHSAVCYGTDTFMYAGHIYCSNDGCREQVVEEYESRKGR